MIDLNRFHLQKGVKEVGLIIKNVVNETETELKE